LADREAQEKAWRDDDYSNYTDFDEIYMGFSDPCEDILTWDLPEDKRALLQKLYDMVDAYNEEYDEKEKTEKDVCDDPKWQEILIFARQVYDNLKHVKYVPDEDEED